MNEGSKYHPLYAYIRQQPDDEFTISFEAVEQLLRVRLPASARTQRAWWSNRSRGAVQANAWMGAGYHVKDVDLVAEQVTFYKPGQIYEVRREGDTVLWDGEMVKALRLHLGLSQDELADQLGMRQQTISDWETGAYAPRRATSNHLTLFAERANFSYNANPK